MTPFWRHPWGGLHWGGPRKRSRGRGDSVLHKILLKLIELTLGGEVADEEDMRNFLERAVGGKVLDVVPSGV